MPWRGPRYPGELPTLGYGVLEWMSTYLPSPRDPTQPFIPTDEQASKILLWFALHPTTGAFIFRRWIQMRAKGWGKSPMMAALMLAALGGAKSQDCAPVLFDGWDASGEPVGHPWGFRNRPSPLIQIAAVSEAQALDNTYSVVYAMLTANDHKAAIALGIDDGRTRLYLKGRPGQLEPVTAAGGSREGQPLTDAVLDETHLWTPQNGGQKLARTMRRNAAKMDGRTIETTNAPLLGENSVAERSLKAALAGAPGIMFDARRPPVQPDPGWSDERLLEALAYSYGDSWWVELPRLLADARDPDAPWDDTLRFFFNIPVAGGGRAVDPQHYDRLAKVRDIPAGTVIGLGFDGSISRDATVLRGCTADGHTFLIRSWPRPVNAPEGWKVDRADVEKTVAETFARYRVGRMFCDPPKWWTEIEGWAKRYGETIVLALDTNVATKFAPATDRWVTAIREGAYSHDGDELTVAHVKAAALRKVRLADDPDDGRTRHVLVRGEENHPIDAAVADCLAFAAAMTMPTLPPAPAGPAFASY